MSTRTSTPISLVVAALSFVAAMAIAALAIAAGGQDPAADELKKLEGTYTMVRGEEGGKPLDPTIVRTAKLTITGDRHVVVLGEETIRGVHKVNPLEKPKSIDSTDTAGRFAGKTTKGIYKLEDGEFTVSFAPPDEARPLEFSTKDKPGRLLHVWKKQGG